jgi:sugar lactone lactonase YvrE
MSHRLHWPALLILAVSLGTAAVHARAEGPVAESQKHLRAAGRAYRDGDLRGFVESLETAYTLNPASLSTRYNLACGYARTGQPEKAFGILGALVDEGVDFGMADDPDLDALRADRRFAEMVAELAANTETVIGSEAYFTFDQLGLIPEGIAADTASGRLFFSSMRTGEIYVVDRDKRVSKFATVDAQGRLSAIGLAVDSRQGLLWAAGSAFDLAENFDIQAADFSGLFAFNLDNGQLEREYRIEGSDFGFNDVAIAPDGSIYVSGGALHYLDPERDMLVPLDTGIEIFGSNGITTDASGETLFVASYPVGIAAVDPESGDARFLELPDGLTLYGVDGLYWYEGGLVAVQNGARPWRLIRLTVDADRSRVTGVDVIERGNTAATPTTGAIVDEYIYYVGEGPGPDAAPGQFPEAMQQNLGPVVIRKAPLTRQ